MRPTTSSLGCVILYLPVIFGPAAPKGSSSSVWCGVSAAQLPSFVQKTRRRGLEIVNSGVVPARPEKKSRGPGRWTLHPPPSLPQNISSSSFSVWDSIDRSMTYKIKPHANSTDKFWRQFLKTQTNFYIENSFTEILPSSSMRLDPYDQLFSKFAAIHLHLPPTPFSCFISTLLLR